MNREKFAMFEFKKDIVIELYNGNNIYCDAFDTVDDEEFELEIKPNERTDKWWPTTSKITGLPITYFFVTPSQVKDMYFYKDKLKNRNE